MKCLRNTALGIIFAILIVNANLFAQTNVSGNISSNTTWTVANSPYVVTADVTVDPGATLTIEAGVTVEFTSGTSLLVDGALVADGDDGSDIVFTSNAGSPAPGDWGTVRFNNNSNVGSVLDYVVMEYGGAGAGGALLSYTTGAYAVDITNSVFQYSNLHGVDLRASSPDIKNSEFVYNAGYGIYSDLSLSFTVDSSYSAHNTQGGIRVPINAAPTITATDIDTNGVGIYMDNGSTAIVKFNNIRGNTTGIRVIEAGSNSPVIEDNTISDNTSWGLRNEGISEVEAEYNYWGARSGPENLANPAGIGDKVSDNVDFDPWLGGSATLPILEITSNPSDGDVWYADTVYVIKNTITLPTSSTLTIQAGTNVKFEPSVVFDIDGTLIADGTFDNVIAFTSIKDDVYGGDTNGDARSTTPAPGDWNYVQLTNSGTSSVLDYVNIRYAGSGAAALQIQSTNVQLSNLFVDNNLRTGIDLNEVPDKFSNIVSNANGNYGFYIQKGVNVKNVVAQKNNQSGMYIYPGYSSFTVSIDSSEFSYNNQSGLVVASPPSGTGGVLDSLTNSVMSFNEDDGFNMSGSLNTSLYFDNNTVEGNGRDGMTVFGTGFDKSSVTISNSTFADNTHIGLRTSSAKLFGNTFDGNKISLGFWGPLGFDYTNLSGTDDNTFTNATYPNSIELKDRALQDTLQADLPADFTGGAYLLSNYNSSPAVENGDILVIEPGVNVKGGYDGAHSFSVEGILIADANDADPIWFSSWRDDNVGGLTTAASDTLSPKPGNWGGLYLSDNASRDTEQSILRNVHIKYGNYGLYVISDGTYTNPIDSLYSAYNNTNVYIQDATVTIENSVIEHSNGHGVYAGDYGSTLPVGELTLRNSVVSNNKNDGIRTLAFSGLSYLLKELSNSEVKNNGNSGLYLLDPPAAVSILGNDISNNGAHGIDLYHKTLDREDVSIAGNTFSDNVKSGVRSSAAKFIDNIFTGNEFGITQHGKLGYRYVDEIGVDGNVFTGNTYNNAIGLSGKDLSDTLSTNFPEAITSGTYMFGRLGLNTGDRFVETGDTLVIEPGVIIKSGHDGRHSMEVNGYLYAKGTSEDPIIFTSFRDTTFGGNTRAVADTVSPQPGAYYYLYIEPSTSGGNNAKYSELEHIKFRYGTTPVYVAGTLGEDIVPVWKNLDIDKSSSNGMFFQDIGATLDSVKINNSNGHGILAYSYSSDPGTTASISISNSEIMNSRYNGFQGIAASGHPYYISQMSNSVISNSGYNGVQIEGSANPMTFQFNTIDSNDRNGLFVTNSEAAVTDTVLTIAGNRITNNARAGIASSRAIIVGDTLEGNKYPIGVTGILSKRGTINDEGNFYQDNVIQMNEVDSAAVIFGYVEGIVGGTKPAGYTQDLYVTDSQLEAGSGYEVWVKAGDSLSIKPGVIFKNGPNTNYRVEGTLISEGEVDDKIIFTSIKDDTFGGNTNNDTTDVVPARNDWHGLELRNHTSDNSKIKNTIFRYGNYVMTLNSSNAVIDSSAFSNSTYAMYFPGGSDATIRSSDIHTNQGGALIYGDSNPVFQLNNFYGNDNFAIQNQTSPSQTIMAENNYWGDSTGPLVDKGSDQNLNGQGDYINAAQPVDYRPFLTGRNGILLGDVTENGGISAFDASNVLQHVVGSITLVGNALAAADVTANGSVSAMDASYILQFVVGNITGFPGQGKAVAKDLKDAFSLGFDSQNTFMDMEVDHLGEASFLANEFDIVIKNNPVDAVQLLPSDISDNLSMTYSIERDTISVAIASSIAMTEEGIFANLRFSYGDKEDDRDMSEVVKFNKFMLNETNLTTHVNAVYTEIEDGAGEVPEEFALKQNYPNPFNPSTNIAYDLPVSGDVRIQVFNILGQLVHTVVDQPQKAGRYQVRWDASQFGSGTYLLRIDFQGDDNNGYSQVRKMLLIK